MSGFIGRAVSFCSRPLHWTLSALDTIVVQKHIPYQSAPQACERALGIDMRTSNVDGIYRGHRGDIRIKK
jgi:hypothetical protein